MFILWPPSRLHFKSLGLSGLYIKLIFKCKTDEHFCVCEYPFYKLIFYNLTLIYFFKLIIDIDALRLVLLQPLACPPSLGSDPVELDVRSVGIWSRQRQKTTVAVDADAARWFALRTRDIVADELAIFVVGEYLQ